MTTHAYVSKRALLRQLPEGEVRDRVARWLDGQPKAPLLVSSKEAASMLGIKPPHISRLKAQGRMPEPIPVPQGNDVYLRSEVETLAKELQREREERARRKEDRNGG